MSDDKWNKQIQDILDSTTVEGEEDDTGDDESVMKEDHEEES